MADRGDQTGVVGSPSDDDREALSERVATAAGLLSKRLDRCPRPSEIAAEAGISCDDVVEILARRVPDEAWPAPVDTAPD